MVFPAILYAMCHKSSDISREAFVCGVDMFVGDTCVTNVGKSPVPSIPSIDSSVKGDLT